MERFSRREFFQKAPLIVPSLAEILNQRPEFAQLFYAQGSIGNNSRETNIRWLIDTGAAISILPPSIASEIGIESRGTTRIVGVGGYNLDVQYCRVPEVKADGWQTKHNVTMAMTELPNLGERTGILGMDFLPRPDCLRR